VGKRGYSSKKEEENSHVKLGESILYTIDIEWDL
jgi:hypothetical protein